MARIDVRVAAVKSTAAVHAAATPELGLIVTMDAILEGRFGPVVIYMVASMSYRVLHHWFKEGETLVERER